MTSVDPSVSSTVAGFQVTFVPSFHQASTVTHPKYCESSPNFHFRSPTQQLPCDRKGLDLAVQASPLVTFSKHFFPFFLNWLIATQTCPDSPNIL